MQQEEPVELVEYLGRMVPKDGFRVYIYHRDGQVKLVNTWVEYTVYLATNDWFATKDEAMTQPQDVVEMEVPSASVMTLELKSRKKKG